MNRKDFIINSCAACLSATAVSGLLSSCKSTQYISGRLNKDGVLLDADEFKMTRKGKTTYRSFIIVRNEALQYPICLYRVSDREYSALWMRCTHQGTELQASGDRLQCTAHGSEFDNKGLVRNGPADKSLRTFPVTVSFNQLFIDLRAI
jgi:Rieske Fe-S protein